MGWNYRILHYDDVEHPHFAINEVYYDNDGNVEMFGAPFEHTDDTPEALMTNLAQMLLDCSMQTVLKTSELRAQMDAFVEKTEASVSSANELRDSDLFDEVNKGSERGRGE